MLAASRKPGSDKDASLCFRVCPLCARGYEIWQLIGGGYEDNWFASLLREAFPVTVCERCFRKSFYKSTEVEEIGLAVLPNVEVRSLRALEVEKFLITARRLYGNTSFEADQFLSKKEIDTLMHDGVLFRTVLLDPTFGTVSVRFMLNPVESDGISVRLAKSQPSVNALQGLSLDACLEVECEATNFHKQRTVSDLYWLWDKLSTLEGGRWMYTLPLLSPPIHLGEYNESLMKLYLSTFHTFLVFSCTTDPFRTNAALEAFLRPGFAIGKIVVDLDDESSLKTGTLFAGKATSTPVEFVQQVAQVTNRLIAMSAAAEASHQVEVELLASLCESAGSSLDIPELLKTSRDAQNSSTPVAFVPVDIDSFAQDQIRMAGDSIRFWQSINDFFHA